MKVDERNESLNNSVEVSMFMFTIWVNYNDLAATSLGIMVRESSPNALIQVLAWEGA